jgi:acetate kinase
LDLDKRVSNLPAQSATSARRDEMVLCLNSGSSTLKFALFVLHAADAEPKVVLEGAIERIGVETGASETNAWLEQCGVRRERSGHIRDHAMALEVAFALLAECGEAAPTLVGHRVVHGGVHYREPIRIDAAVVATLRTLVSLAPHHMPAAIASIDAIQVRYPNLPQFACFDTAFHARMPELAQRLPLPQRFHQEGVRRYGFHGLSYEYVLSCFGARPPARMVVAHLGCSLAAVLDGRGIDTTMGFTPSGGIFMGTRTGDLDPGVFIHLLRAERYTVEQLEQLVERESGLLAVGGSADMATLMQRASTDAAAQLAIRMFGYTVRKSIGSLVAALGGIDALVFTGGIGTHVAAVRAEACRGMQVFGVDVDAERNERGADIISYDGRACLVRVLATNEALMMARHAVHLR